MKNILILGGGGFVGRNLQEYFASMPEHYKIDAPSSKELNLLHEPAVAAYLNAQRYDVVIHAAVYNPRTDAQKDARRELECDLRMYYNLARYNHLFGKMLYFGSGAEFDKRAPIKGVGEDDAGNGIPTNDYGLAKYIINQDVRNRSNIFNLRIFGLFGKYENWKTTFISGACCKAVKDLPITIRQNVYFDYLYIDDFCSIVRWFVDNDAVYKEYNVVSGRRVDLISIAEDIKRISGKNLPVYICKEGLANEYTASNERLLAEIGDFTFTSMEKAMQSLYLWYDNHQTGIDLTSLLYQ